MKLSKILLVVTLLSMIAPACTNPSAIPNVTASQMVSERQKAREDDAEEDRQEEARRVDREQAARSDGGDEVEETPDPVVIDEQPEAEERASDTGDLWRWDLEVGDSYRLIYEGTTDISMSFSGQMGDMMGDMMGAEMRDEMGDEITDQIRMDTELELHVERILPDGRYDLRIPVTRLEIESASGERMTLSDLPEEVRVLRAYMTPRGTLEFYERVMVEVREEGRSYGMVRMSQDGSATSGDMVLGAGDMEMTARADVDPETGRVSLSQSVRKREPQTRKEQQDRPVQHIDVLPADLLSMLELPEGPIAAGDHTEVDGPMGTIEMEAGEPVQCSESSCGELRVRLDVDTEPMNQAAADAHHDDSFHDSGMDDDMDMHGDMEMDDDMDMDDDMEMHGDMAMAMQPTMQAEVDATMLFDVPRGLLFNIEGTSGTVSGSGGFEVQESTEFMLIILE